MADGYTINYLILDQLLSFKTKFNTLLLLTGILLPLKDLTASSLYLFLCSNTENTLLKKKVILKNTLDL